MFDQESAAQADALVSDPKKLRDAITEAKGQFKPLMKKFGLSRWTLRRVIERAGLEAELNAARKGSSTYRHPVQEPSAEQTQERQTIHAAIVAGKGNLRTVLESLQAAGMKLSKPTLDRRVRELHLAAAVEKARGGEVAPAVSEAPPAKAPKKLDARRDNQVLAGGLAELDRKPKGRRAAKKGPARG